MRSVVALFACASALLLAAPAGGITLPAGFVDEPVATLAGPTALGFTPEGRILMTTQAGRLRVVRDGALLGTAALDLSAKLCSDSERGLLGVAVDPAFGSTNRFVYLYYTWKKFGTCVTNSPQSPVNRVSRFVLRTDDTIDPASETVLVDNIPSPNGNHNAGDLAFGRDGYLYVSVGDGGCDYAGGGCAGSNDASRDRNVLVGKILRITRDGAVPPDNPFRGAGSASCAGGGAPAGTICQETFAWGLRNPFRLAFDPNASGTSFYINDVGQNVWEEIDLGTAGADYGWNVREGPCANGSTTNCGPPPAGMTNPIFAYDHSGGCASITGGAFVPNGAWPAPYSGAYLFADYVCGTIFRLQPNGSGGFDRVPFATNLGGSSAVHLDFGAPDGSTALYYTTYANGGEVRRIRLANGTPTAAMSASPTSGSAPLAVVFDGSGSSDPEGGALTYLWDFGDGGTNTTTTPATMHTYAVNGTYTASLRVRDAQGATSGPVTVTIAVGNTPPTPTIVSPAAGATFSVGQTITLSGSASDAQDGQLPASKLSWQVLLHHNTHTHPLFSGTGTNLTFTAPAPEDLEAAPTSYVEIQLTATDSGGLSTTTTRDIQPVRVSLTFATQPSGLTVVVNGSSFTGPSTLTSWAGWQLNLDAPTPQGRYVFRSWSDGGARAHTITTPSAPATYTARFKRGR